MVVDGDALSSLVDPAYSHFRLPGNIQTEKDTEDAFKTTFLDGINGILRYEQARQELQRASSRTLRHEDILDNIVRNMSPSTDQTYSSSPRRTASTSDFAHFNRTRVLDSQLAPICIEELKTPKAFDAFEYLLENICAESPALKDVEGWAVRFVWPEENSAFHDHKMSKGSLVLAQVRVLTVHWPLSRIHRDQVWADMVDTNEKQFGILSSGERSYFLRRNRTVDEFKGTLFISLLCAVTDFPFLTIYSWVAHSLSQLPVPPNFVLETPIVNQVWYQGIPLTPGHYGIDH
ncbi:hypothetical protein H0H93_009441, partial [Arthromyces matolae]